MLAWTVIEREMRTAARRPWAWRGRMIPALLAILPIAAVVVFDAPLTPEKVGEMLFNVVGMLMFFYAGLGGMLMTSDCLSHEKREGTLGLLFLTDLRPADVLLGKAVASSFRVLLGILAVVPVLAVGLIAGGVTLRDVGLVTLATLNLLFLSMASGMLASSLQEHANKAFSAALAFFLFFLAGMPLLGVVSAEFKFSQGYPEWVTCFSPGTTCYFALLGRGQPAIGKIFTISLLVVHVLGWVMLALARRFLMRSIKTQHSGAKEGWWRNPWKGSRAYRDRVRTELLDQNAYLWRCALPVRKPVAVWLVIGTLWAVYGAGCLFKPEYFRNPASLFFIFIASSALFKLWLASDAPHPLCADRQSGALELLAITPLSTQDLVRGHLAALRRQFQAPVMVVCIFGLVLCVLASYQNWAFTLLHDIRSPLLRGMLIAILDLYTLSYLSVAGLSVTASEIKIRVVSLVLVLVVPWVFFAFLGSFVSFLAFLFGFSYGNYSVIRGQEELTWLISCVVWDFLLLLWARKRLRVPLSQLAWSSGKGTGR